MNVRMLCLSILNFGEATGYEIRKKSVEGNFSYFVDASYGAIYPALNKLTAEGLVECRDEVQAGKPARKVYSITPAGRRAFLDAIAEMPDPDTFKSQFLLVAICAEYLDREHLRKVIDARIAEMRRVRDELSEARVHCDHAGSLWSLDYGINCHQSCIDYLVENRDQLLAIAGTALTSEAAE